MVQLQQEHPEDIAAISLNLDYSGDSDAPADYREEVGGFLNSIRASAVENVVSGDSFDDVMATFAENFQTDGVPVVLVYGRDGKLLKSFNGEAYDDEISPFVKTALRQESESTSEASSE